MLLQKKNHLKVFISHVKIQLESIVEVEKMNFAVFFPKYITVLSFGIVIQKPFKQQQNTVKNLYIMHY